jgi:hypothetical protein
MKDSMWQVDRVSGRRFRDPKDLNQLALAIEDEPDLSGLKETLISYVEAKGEATLQDLKELTLKFTIYRPPHATQAIAELSEEGKVERIAGRGHDKTIVRPAPLRLF